MAKSVNCILNGSRYGDSLEDVVGKICARMDLSLFEEGNDESPLHSFNSDEINRVPPKERHRKLGAETNAAGDRCSKQLKTARKRSRGGGVDFKKLREAQEKRERARRFSSFTTWMPDLRRVWAPLKQQMKGMKPKSDSMLEFLSERKVGRYGSHDRVCETPEPEKRSSEEEEEAKHRRLSFSPISRALFQDA